MPVIRTLLALFLCTSVGLSAETVKLRNLAGKTVHGELIKVSEKEVVLNENGTPVTTALPEVLDLDLQRIITPPGVARYADVELADGSLLHCLQFSLKGQQTELKLAGGKEVKVPLAAMAYVLNDAQDAKVREEWQALLAKRGNHDLLAIRREGVVNPIEGTFGEGDDTGETIGFETAGGVKRRLKLAGIHALGFLRKSDPDAAPTVCKVLDTSGNLFMARQVVLDNHVFIVTTVSGIKLDFPPSMLSKLDYSQDKLVYLSDLEPIRVKERSTLDRVEHYRRDQNLDGGPLRVGKDSYPKGLAVHAYTELVYDIGGQYKEFKVVLGVDPGVGGDSHVKVLIEGDNRELFTGEVRPEPRP